MTEPMDIVEQAVASEMKRRDFLTKAAATGAVVWAAPVILSRPAHAFVGAGSPDCQPPFMLQCEDAPCGDGLGNITFPGIRIVSDEDGSPLFCPCRSTLPGCTNTPTVCVKITGPGGGPLGQCGGHNLVIYASGTECKKNFDFEQVLPQGCWQTLVNPNQPIFFGPARESGAINALGSDCCIKFRIVVWVGGCCDTTGSPATRCATFDVVLAWDQGMKMVNCTDQAMDPDCSPIGISEVMNDPGCPLPSDGNPCLSTDPCA